MEASATPRVDRGAFTRFQLGIWALLTATMLLPALGHPTAMWPDALRWGAGWALVGVGVSTAIGLLLARLPTERLQGLRAVAVTLPVALAGAAVWVLGERALAPLIGTDPFIPPALPRDRLLVMNVVRGSVLLAFWAALFLVTLLATRVQQEREHAALARAAAHEAQLELLRSQLNPHFLFNALNSVVALVGENPKAAQGMVRDVSALLRRALDADGKRETTLAEELDFIGLYLKCEQVRFEEKLRVELDVAPELGSLRLPPMLLHPLVENAVKHGMRQLATPALTVRVTARVDGGVLRVEVANGGRLEAPTGGGIGLRNVRERLAQLYPGTASLKLEERGGEVVASVSFPVQRSGGARS